MSLVSISTSYWGVRYTKCMWFWGRGGAIRFAEKLRIKGYYDDPFSIGLGQKLPNEIYYTTSYKQICRWAGTVMARKVFFRVLSFVLSGTVNVFLTQFPKNFQSCHCSVWVFGLIDPITKMQASKTNYAVLSLRNADELLKYIQDFWRRTDMRSWWFLQEETHMDAGERWNLHTYTGREASELTPLEIVLHLS